jgi:hypothetical protein
MPIPAILPRCRQHPLNAEAERPAARIADRDDAELDRAK